MYYFGIKNTKNIKICKEIYHFNILIILAKYKTAAALFI